MEKARLSLRLKALFFDYLLILGYLIVLALVTAGISIFLLGGLPETTETQSQWVAFLTTIVPVVIFFTVQEGRAPYASFGKKKIGLKMQYVRHPMLSSLIRNSLKFLPWHLGHYAVIKGIFTEDFSSPGVYIPYFTAVILPIVYVLMVGIRKDHRHIPDLVAGNQVVISKKEKQG